MNQKTGQKKVGSLDICHMWNVRLKAIDPSHFLLLNLQHIASCEAGGAMFTIRSCIRPCSPYLSMEFSDLQAHNIWSTLGECCLISIHCPFTVLAEPRAQADCGTSQCEANIIIRSVCKAMKRGSRSVAKLKIVNKALWAGSALMTCAYSVEPRRLTNQPLPHVARWPSLWSTRAHKHWNVDGKSGWWCGTVSCCQHGFGGQGTNG